MTPDEKLEICKQTRRIAVDTLFETLNDAFKNNVQTSEASLRDGWIKNLGKRSEIFPNGWYEPPPHGIGMLVGTSNENSRHNYQSLRPEEMWPKAQNIIDESRPLLYAYASPVNRAIGIIGDFGMSLYFGQKPEVFSHLRNCLEITKKIAESIRIGMTFSEIYQSAQDLFEESGTTNKITSITDPASTNIGHTIPFSYEQMSEEEKGVLESGIKDWQNLKAMISKKRKFISPVETFEVKPEMALTLEPRLTVRGNSQIPMSSYHTILLIKAGGEKELLTGFDEIFKLVGMDYLLP